MVTIILFGIPFTIASGFPLIPAEKSDAIVTIDAGGELGYPHWKRFESDRFRMPQYIKCFLVKPGSLGCRKWGPTVFPNYPKVYCGGWTGQIRVADGRGSRDSASFEDLLRPKGTVQLGLIAWIDLIISFFGWQLGWIPAIQIHEATWCTGGHSNIFEAMT